MTIDGEGISDTVSVGRATLASTAKETPTKDTRMQTDETESKREKRILPVEFFVHPIVRHVRIGNEIKYVLRLYGCTIANDEGQPHVDIREDCITRY